MVQNIERDMFGFYQILKNYCDTEIKKIGMKKKLEKSKNIFKEFIKIFPYPDIVIEENYDIYMHINLNNDSINDYKDYAFSNPLEITIDDNNIDFSENWIDVLTEILIELYNYDTENFIKVSKPIIKEYKWPIIL